MSWVSENKFLTGFGAVMLVGVGTLGTLTYLAMDKYDAAASAFDTANAQLKRLHDSKPGLKDSSLKDLLAQKQEMTDKISTFQQELKTRVLPMETISKAAFQDKLKETVAQISAKAAAANVERPKDFYLGFGKYQSSPPDDKATPALARELRAIEMVLHGVDLGRQFFRIRFQCRSGFVDAAVQVSERRLHQQIVSFLSACRPVLRGHRWLRIENQEISEEYASVIPQHK